MGKNLFYFSIEFRDASRTQQSFRDDCDINKIVAKFSRNGELDALLSARNDIEALYRDVSDLPDYKDALDVVSSVDDVFDSLPAKLRSHFHNDPAVFADHVFGEKFSFDDLVALSRSHENDEFAGEGRPALPEASSVSDSKASEAPDTVKTNVENVVES